MKDEEIPVLQEDELKNINFGKVMYNEYRRGYNQGFAERGAEVDQILRSRISNQRRELRRLNRQLNAIREGMKVA